MRVYYLYSLLFFYVNVKCEELSQCLKDCVLPLAKQERSFSHVFNNFEKVCDMLEEGAFCVRKCEREDQNKFQQYATFYRMICVDYEEDLEPHLSCLSKVAKDVDAVCQDRCNGQGKYSENPDKQDKQTQGCMAIECSTVCYYQEFVEECPKAQKALMKLNIGQIHSIASTIHPISFEKMGSECQRIHNTDYMRKKLETTEV